jgi:RNA polymerase sigma-70 factor (ECF subfamily)
MFRNKSSQRQVLIDMTDKQKRYEALVGVYHKDLYRFAYWLCHDATIAEDLVQDTFLRAWRSLDSLSDPKAAKAWLITILRRENARRFERKQFEYEDVDQDTLAHQGIADLEHSTELSWLQKQIMQLSEEYREPLLLQVMMGFDGDEIAQILLLNKNTVMTRLFRARNQLKDKLQTSEHGLRGAQ